MTAPGNSAIIITLIFMIIVTSGYSVGRIHQRNMDTSVREEAYRKGYDKMSHSLFSVVHCAASSSQAGRARQGIAGRRGAHPSARLETSPAGSESTAYRHASCGTSA